MTHNPHPDRLPDDRELLDALSALKAVRPSPSSRQAARSAIAGRVAARQAAGPVFRAHRRLPLLASFAVIPLLGIGVVGAAVGGGLPGPVATILGTSSAEDAHENARGCDDVNPAVQGDPQPGGPADCTVGNSDDHRANGDHRTNAKKNATATPEAEPSAAASPSAAAGPDRKDARGSDASAAAHSNGKGCDDVNPAVQGTPTPGGPTDCTVGNSGDHRQNGKKEPPGDGPRTTPRKVD